MADVVVNAEVASATGSANSLTSTVAPSAQEAASSAVALGSASTTTSASPGTATALGASLGGTLSFGYPSEDTATADEEVAIRATGDYVSGDQPHCLLWHPDHEGWAVEQMQARHNGVLWRFGEYSMFVLLWRIEDFNAGRVGRCQECMTPKGDIAEVYNQSFKTQCSTCYGTTFDGGFKAKIIRPALWDYSETTNKSDVQGEVERANTAVQSTPDFAMRTGDYILRADGTRWRVQSLSTNHLRTGFGFPDRAETIIGFNYGNVVLQDPASNAYAIQVPTDLSLILDVTNPRVMQEFSRFEEIRGPLLAGSPNPSVSTTGHPDPAPVAPNETYAHLHGAQFEMPGWNLT